MRTGVRGDTETIAIRLPKSIVAAIDKAAADVGTSRGNYLACIIIERTEKNGDLYYAPDPPKPKGSEGMDKKRGTYE
jgi:predicted DNA-binding protein